MHASVPSANLQLVAQPSKPDPHRLLTFEHGVPRRLVHKAAVSEVLLTDALMLDTDRFVVAAQWPREHLLYNGAANGSSDPLLVAETIRQAVIYLSHRFYAVPEGHHFILDSLEFDIDAPGIPQGTGSPLAVVLDVSCVPTTDNPRRFAMDMECSIHVEGHRYGRAGLRWGAMDHRRYTMLRRPEGPAPKPAPTAVACGPALRPADVGHLHERDVLLSPVPHAAPGTWLLKVDQDHPVLFDHGSDHIPGMVLLEAFRQACHPAAQRDNASAPTPSIAVLTFAATSFSAFGRLGAPVTITSHPAPGSDDLCFGLAATQEGRTLATGIQQWVRVPKPRIPTQRSHTDREGEGRC
ncbi:lactone biosynthesis protein, mmfl [Kitasatospora sp. NBC_00374]|uniref:ScbA/BarX family gamma-butyrolactone biosynthesis protein n=1 Tax=Kitasatospora sp. NBC_00374 TaxID=2975964 RepID=UPI0030E0DC03